MNLRLSKNSIALRLSLLVLLSGCAVGKDYTQPSITELGTKWNAVEVDSDATAKAKQFVILRKDLQPLKMVWWKEMADSQLAALIQRATHHNNEIQQASQRIEEAKAFQRGEYSGLWPQIEAIAAGKREALGAINGQLLDTTQQAGLSGNWLLDIFGGNRRKVEAAKAAIEAFSAARDAVRLAVVADTAIAYIELRSAQQQRVLVERNLHNQRQTMEMVKAQRHAGAVTDLDVVRAEAQVDATEARLPAIDAALFASLNRLAVLTAMRVETLRQGLEQTAEMPELPKQHMLAMPLQAIANRPDLTEAERRLAQASALSAAALAEFYPKISLGGFFGISDSSQFGSASPWNVAINGVLPLLNFGRIESGVDAADARQKQAFYGFKQVILKALEETENALFAFFSEQRRLEELSAVAQLQSRAASIAKAQYTAGVTAQIDLLTAERDQLEAESEVIASQATVAINWVKLHRALASPVE